VRPGSAPAHADTVTGAGLGSMFARSAPQRGAPALIAARKLDRGRLSAAKLVAAARFGCHAALAADVSRPDRVLLRAAPATPRRAGDAEAPFAGTHTAHTDGSGAIVVPAGLRAHLGIDDDGEIVAHLVADPADPDARAVELLSPAVVETALALADEVERLTATKPTAGRVPATVNPERHTP